MVARARRELDGVPVVVVGRARGPEGVPTTRPFASLVKMAVAPRATHPTVANEVTLDIRGPIRVAVFRVADVQKLAEVGVTRVIQASAEGESEAALNARAP